MDLRPGGSTRPRITKPRPDPPLARNHQTPGGPGWLPTQGSHRSGRARLAHPAPRDTVSLREVDDRIQPRSWKRVPFQHKRETVPVHVSLARATIQPLSPDPSHPVSKLFQGAVVAADAKVGIMSPELPDEMRMLLGDRKVPIPSTPFRDAMHRLGETTPGRLLLHHPGSLARATPVIVETQEVETSRGQPVFH